MSAWLGSERSGRRTRTPVSTKCLHHTTVQTPKSTERPSALLEGLGTIAGLRWISTVAFAVTYKDTAGRLECVEPLLAGVGPGQSGHLPGVEQPGQAGDFNLGAGQLSKAFSACQLGEHLIGL